MSHQGALAADAPGEAEPIDAAVWKISAVAMLGGLLAQLDATIVNVSLSSLASELHSSLSTIQWVTSGYLLALTLVLPLNGWLVDRIGAKALYLWCFSAFVLSSALCGLAWSAGSLVAFRVLQGVSGGLLAPMTQMMIARVAGKHMARVVGRLSVPVMMAPVLGPVIAGAVLQHASWRWLFLLNLPVGALALLLAVLFLPNDRSETKRRSLDWIGLALLSPGLALFLYGADRIGEASGRGALAAGVALIAAFVWSAVRKGDRALVDLRLFKGDVFATSVALQFLSNGVLFAGQMLVPLFLIQACGRSPQEMGWMLAPLGLGLMIAIPSMDGLMRRFGIRRVAAGGALLALAATPPLLYMAKHGLDLPLLEVALLLRGMGQGAVGLPSLTAAYATIERPALPMATTSMNILQRLGGPTLTTLCATVLGWRLHTQGVDHQAMPDAYVWAFWLLCGLHALMAGVALRLPRRIAEEGDRSPPAGERGGTRGAGGGARRRGPAAGPPAAAGTSPRAAVSRGSSVRCPAASARTRRRCASGAPCWSGVCRVVPQPLLLAASKVTAYHSRQIS